jgi:hypothetical protein
MPSSAESYFAEVLSGGYGYLTGLPTRAEPVEEREWLDFKGYYPGEEEKSLRSHWSACLSAFANTEGGVLVWGIRAERPKGSRVERVSGLAEVQRPREWKQRLKDWLLQATDPPVGGIRIEAVTHETEERGFVVCLIPESASRPHRAELVENKPYFIRVADNCVVPNRSLLRAMFFPHSQPRFRLRASYRPLNESENRYIIELENVGSATALNVYCNACTEKTFAWKEITNGIRVNPGSNSFNVVSQIALHPGMVLPITFTDTEEKRLSVSIRVYAHDAAPQCGGVVLEWPIGAAESDLAPLE